MTSDRAFRTVFARAKHRQNWHAGDVAAWIVAIGVFSLGISIGRSVSSGGWQLSAWWIMLALVFWLTSWWMLAWLLTCVRRRGSPRTFDAVASTVSLLAVWLLMGNWMARTTRLDGIPVLSGNTARWVAALVVAAAITLTARRLRMGTILLTSAAVVALIAPIQSIIGSWPSSGESVAEVSVSFDQRSTRPSVLWIVADEARYGLFYTPDGRVRDAYPNLQHLQEQSTTYTHSLSVSSHTNVAVPAMLAATIDASALGQDQLESLAEQPVVLEGLASEYSMVWHSQYLPTPCLIASCDAPGAITDAQSLTTAWQKSWLALTGGLIARPLRDWLPKIGEVDLWDSAKYVKGTDFLQQMQATLAQQPDRPVFAFWHYLGTHTNWNLDFDGRQIFTTSNLVDQIGGGVTRDDTGALLSVEHEALERRLYAASAVEFDRQLGILLDGLRDSGHFEDTLIAFTADHGTAIAIADTERRPTSDLDLMWAQVAHIPTMIKEPGQTSENIVTSSRSVGQTMSTILDASGATLTAPWRVAPPLSQEPDDEIIFTAVRGEALEPEAFDEEDRTDPWNEDDFGSAPSPFSVGISADALGQPVPNDWVKIEASEVRTALGPSPFKVTRISWILSLCGQGSGVVLVANDGAIIGTLAMVSNQNVATGILPQVTQGNSTYWCRPAS